MRGRTKRIMVVGAGLLVAVLVAWLIVNPPGTFGYCRFGLTVYGSVPYPACDIQVRADGTVRRVAKTHDLRLSAVQWLRQPRPEVLIIATGCQGAVEVGREIHDLKNCTVETLRTREAIERFRELKKHGKKVAIHIHSTC